VILLLSVRLCCSSCVCAAPQAVCNSLYCFSCNCFVPRVIRFLPCGCDVGTSCGCAAPSVGLLLLSISAPLLPLTCSLYSLRVPVLLLVFEFCYPCGHVATHADALLPQVCAAPHMCVCCSRCRCDAPSKGVLLLMWVCLYLCWYATLHVGVPVLLLVGVGGGGGSAPHVNVDEKTNIFYIYPSPQALIL
jgi:hypothetical protein